MPIYLVQHGKSNAKAIDPERGLTDEGAQEVRSIAERLMNNNTQVDVIWHSGKTRARQTAEILADRLTPSEGVKARAGLNPNDDATGFAASLDNSGKQMFVGHLPFMTQLVSELCTHDRQCGILQFRNAGVVCLDQDQAGDWLIQCYLIPGS